MVSQQEREISQKGVKSTEISQKGEKLIMGLLPKAYFSRVNILFPSFTILTHYTVD